MVRFVGMFGVWVIGKFGLSYEKGNDLGSLTCTGLDVLMSGNIFFALFD